MSGKKSQPPRAMVGNASDPEQVEKAKNKEISNRDRELNDLRTVLAGEQGRRLLWRVLGFCGIRKHAFGADDAQTNFNCGAQNVGHFVLAEILEADAENYFQMMREAQQEKES